MLFRDLSYAFRMLRRNTGFTVVAVLALTLGIGVNTAVFTTYNAMFRRPLDAHDPGRMANLAMLRDSGAVDFSFSYPDYEAYRDSLHSFGGLIAFSPEHLRLTNAGNVLNQRDSAAQSILGRWGLLDERASNAEFASTFVVSENYFKVLGVSAIRGRTFDAVTVPDLIASPSVLISENYWQRRFYSDPAILGKSFRLNGAAVTVIGITPHDFVGTSVAAPDFWLPLTLAPLIHGDDHLLDERNNRFCRLFGHLAPGATLGQAKAEMTAVASRLRALHDPQSEAAKHTTALVWPGSPLPRPLSSFPGLTLAVSLIMLAAAMVLAVACANVGSLQLARSRSRQDELRTRLSLGASRLQIIRQLLTESGLLSIVAGISALLFTWALLKVAATIAAQDLPVEYGTLVWNLTPDLQIFVYVLAISLTAGLLFGLAPAFASTHLALASGARGSTLTIRSRRLQNLLVGVQVALSLVLMIAGSLFIRSSIRSLKTEPGYDSKQVVVLNLQFPEGSRYTAARKSALVGELRTRLAALPGVTTISAARAPGDDGLRTAGIHYTYVQANYFQTLGIPLLLGRAFSGQSNRSVVLSESAAQQFWPHQNPIGRTLPLGPTDEHFHDQTYVLPGSPLYQVIGVARDIRGIELDGSDSRQIYLPMPEQTLADHPILLRTHAAPTQVTKVLDQTIASVDPDLVATFSTLDEVLRQSASFITSSLGAAIASTIGLFGLLLALMGIYGTVSYIVVLRTREIGIRMAVGAQKHDILRLILGESARPVLVGLIAGMLVAGAASYLLRGLLFGLNLSDGISFGGVSLLFLAIAVLAACPPSLRATRIDPVVALRDE